MKKGDLSINIIVVAAIALLVLVIIAVLLFDSAGNVQYGTSCQGLPGGICGDDPTCTTVGSVFSETAYVPASQDCPDNKFCCIPIQN